MAKMRTGALRKLHADLGQILADYDASRSAEGSAGEDNDLGTGPQSSVAGAQDSARGRGKSMADAFPHFNRIKKQ
jgi:hypothetical protein